MTLPLVVTNSLLDDLRKCPRLAYFKHWRGWTGEKPSMPLTAGRAFGNAAGEWLAKRDVLSAVRILQEQWVLDAPGATKADTYSTFAEMLSYFIEVTKDLEGEIVLENEVEAPLGSGIVYQGHIDATLHQEGASSFIEIKTMRESGWNSVTPQKYALAPQQLGYDWLGRKRLGAAFKGLVSFVCLVSDRPEIHVVPCTPTPLQQDAWKQDALWWAGVWKDMVESGSPGGCNFGSCGLYKQRCFATDLCLSGAPPQGLQPPEGLTEPA